MTHVQRVSVAHLKVRLSATGHFGLEAELASSQIVVGSSSECWREAGC